MTDLDPRVEQSLRATHEALERKGELLTSDKVRAAYGAFRDRFGPEALRSLDGQALLQVMHAHGTKDSLVYWLEFKNDDEFSGQWFGGIGGGTAHKFGIFRRKETAQWVKGGSRNEENISESEAVSITRVHRDQLMGGIRLLEKLTSAGSDNDYAKLQTELKAEAPDLYDSGWAHKYWFLMCPEKLDNYHNGRYQRSNLLKLLEQPPLGQGLFICAGRFVALARRFGWSIGELTRTVNERNGRPAKYWRIGTRVGAARDSIWESMHHGGYVAIGFASLGDLSRLEQGAERRDQIKERLATNPGSLPQVAGRQAGQIRSFVDEIAEGEIVMAADGERILGIGRVTGPYRFETTEPLGAPHRRAVQWLSTEQWKLPVTEGLQTTVHAIKKAEENILAIERRVLDAAGREPPGKPIGTKVTQAGRLAGVPGRVQAVLDRKGQVILYGPPGTGKTYWAQRAVEDLAALSAFGHDFSELQDVECAEIRGTAHNPGVVRLCTFHPNYGYEDFLEGYRPAADVAGKLTFELRDGIFKRICDDAKRTPGRKFFLLIDEINRGDIPRIFGELLTLLELDKRNVEVTLPLSGKAFAVPANVFIVGTMNTADRSIALLDTALRRRFGFVELMPDLSIFEGATVQGLIPLGPWLGALNQRIRDHLGRDGRHLQIGHAYLMEAGKPVSDFARFTRILADDVVPLIEEYCYGDVAGLRKILGEGLVDEREQRIRVELFAPSKRDELARALLVPSPDIVTSVNAGGVEDGTESNEAEDDGGES